MNPVPNDRSGPRIIPVIDVMNGRVVRAAGGRRETYRPLRSRLTDSTYPNAVADALLAATGVNELYVADLDAITGPGGVSACVAELLRTRTCRVWVDTGIGATVRASDLPVALHVCPVVGFETARTPDVLADTLCVPGFGAVALSIDLRDGELVGDWRGWGIDWPRDVIGLARRAAGLGAGTLIVLDVARVGMAGGCGTEDVLRAIRDSLPDVELIAGGGVRNRDDVSRLGDAGADAILVASALHDGTFGSLG